MYFFKVTLALSSQSKADIESVPRRDIAYRFIICIHNSDSVIHLQQQIWFDFDCHCNSMIFVSIRLQMLYESLVFEFCPVDVNVVDCTVLGLVDVNVAKMWLFIQVWLSRTFCDVIWCFEGRRFLQLWATTNRLSNLITEYRWSVYFL